MKSSGEFIENPADGRIWLDVHVVREYKLNVDKITAAIWDLNQIVISNRCLTHDKIKLVLHR